VPSGFSSPEKSDEPTAITDNLIDSGVLSLPGCGKVDFLSVIDKTYILARADSGLLIIDQHAAHERIIFERILNDYKENNLSQHLLIPVTVTLSRAEISFVSKYIGNFRSVGFEIDLFGADTILVSAVPQTVLPENVSGLISDILDGLLNNSEQHVKIDETAVARQACRFAVKANDPLAKIEITELIKLLSKCKFPFTCPHGRPTLISISFKELEKRFGRIL
jgi:DNA mismatch repair protein MutL